MVRLVHLPRVGLFPVFSPAQLPQARADVAGAGGGAPGIGCLQAAPARLAGAALGTGE
jgi:hypothetical protein